MTRMIEHIGVLFGWWGREKCATSSQKYPMEVVFDIHTMFVFIRAYYLCSFWYRIRPTVTGQGREDHAYLAKSLKSASNYIFRVPSVDELSTGTT
jgi:hypothetical protein